MLGPAHDDFPQVLTVFTFCSYRVVASEAQELPYRIELWDDHDTHVEELIALVADHAVARAAFVEAIRRRPGKIIVLRQRSRVLADSRR